MQSLERQNLALEEIVVSDEEEAEIRELASSPDIYDRLSSSIAPSIFGYGENQRNADAANCLGE